MSRLRHVLVLPAALLLTALLFRLALLHARTGAVPGLSQPLAVATDWNAFGALLCAVLAVLLACATWPYLRLLSGAPVVADAWSTTAGCALALACAWAVPVLFSSDVYAYAAYGELARVGGDPYGHTLLSAADPLLRAAIWQWGNPPPVCVYGPAFVALAHAIVTIAAPLGTIAQLDGFRFVACAALVACVPLAYAAFRGTRAQRWTAAAAIGLNPVNVWCVAEGHNDAIALCVVLAGFALARRGWLTLGAAVAALSGLVKLPGLAAAVAFGWHDRRARIGAAAGIALVLAFSAPLFRAAQAHLVRHGHYAPLASLQGLLYPLAAMASRSAAAAIALSLAAATTSWLAIAGIARLRRRRIEGWIYLAVGAWLLIPNPYPWYGIWLVAVAALSPTSRAARCAIFLSLAALLRYLPDAAGNPSPALVVLLGAGATLPLAMLRYRASDER